MVRPSGWSWAPVRPTVDAVAVVALVALTIVVLPYLNRGGIPSREPDLTAYALVGVAGLAALLRRWRPATALLVAAAATAIYLVMGYAYGPIFGFILLTQYAVARRLPVSRAVPLAVATFVLLLLHLITDPNGPGLLGVVPAAAWVVLPFTVGVARRMVTQSRARERAVADQQLLDAERLRLAQEVHDVVGHGLAAIQMQADIALHVEDRRPDQARAALKAISTASAEALSELRSTLAAIHPDSAQRSPTPGLARVEELCRRVEQAGVQVSLTVTGTPRPLATAADVTAYRVLQEALTNVVKHSPHPAVDVRVMHTDDAVSLEVSNGDLAPAHQPGLGITGMRRRIAQVGGTFSAGPGPDPGRFVVRATIPRSESA